jgi:hypothetical protein
VAATGTDNAIRPQRDAQPAVALMSGSNAAHGPFSHSAPTQTESALEQTDWGRDGSSALGLRCSDVLLPGAWLRQGGGRCHRGADDDDTPHVVVFRWARAGPGRTCRVTCTGRVKYGLPVSVSAVDPRA